MSSDVATESLEAFLDGEMSEEQARAFRKQLETDTDLAEALRLLVTERETRSQFFATLEHHDSAEDEVVGRLLGNVERAIDQDERRALARSDRMRMLRYISSAAACVVFSFFAGWIGHRHTTGLSLPIAGISSADQSEASLGNGTLVSNLISSGNGQNAHAGGVNVILKDKLGNVVAVQHFDSRDEAREFMQDLGRWQQRQQQMRRADTLLLKDQF